ncbi:hypothetical protein CUMW_097500 [Citrus unshiu]|uniref:Uncharacterized protein n=1 Tax=Citrus unshiu TaxID=55188 RepID=A0A2H5P297_CITUN|nr:hypothetical protein CUMW_097500 [Citrus unshiu]
MHLWPSMRIRDSFKISYLKKLEWNLSRMNSEKKQQSQSNDQQQTLLVDDNNQRNDISETPSSKKSHFGSGFVAVCGEILMLALIMKRTEAVSVGACDQYNNYVFDLIDPYCISLPTLCISYAFGLILGWACIRMWIVVLTLENGITCSTNSYAPQQILIKSMTCPCGNDYISKIWLIELALSVSLLVLI